MNINNVSLLLLLFVVVFVIVTARVQNKFTKKISTQECQMLLSLGPELEEWKTCYI